MRSKKSAPHERSMDSNARFAFEDAIWIAQFLLKKFTVAKAKETFENYGLQDTIRFETKNETLLFEFLNTPKKDRGAFFKSVSDNSSEETQILFLVLAIVGLMRARHTMAIRDRYRYVLLPSSRQYETQAFVLKFANEMAASMDYSWPQPVFDEIDHGTGSSQLPHEDAERMIVGSMSNFTPRLETPKKR